MYIELCGILLDDEEIKQYVVHFNKIKEMHYSDGILHIKDLGEDGNDEDMNIEFIKEADAKFHYEKIRKELIKDIKVL